MTNSGIVPTGFGLLAFACRVTIAGYQMIIRVVIFATVNQFWLSGFIGLGFECPETSTLPIVVVTHVDRAGYDGMPGCHFSQAVAIAYGSCRVDCRDLVVVHIVRPGISEHDNNNIVMVGMQFEPEPYSHFRQQALDERQIALLPLNDHLPLRIFPVKQVNIDFISLKAVFFEDTLNQFGYRDILIDSAAIPGVKKRQRMFQHSFVQRFVSTATDPADLGYDTRDFTQSHPFPAIGKIGRPGRVVGSKNK